MFPGDPLFELAGLLTDCCLALLFLALRALRAALLTPLFILIAPYLPLGRWALRLAYFSLGGPWRFFIVASLICLFLPSLSAPLGLAFTLTYPDIANPDVYADAYPTASFALSLTPEGAPYTPLATLTQKRGVWGARMLCGWAVLWWVSHELHKVRHASRRFRAYYRPPQGGAGGAAIRGGQRPPRDS